MVKIPMSLDERKGRTAWRRHALAAPRMRCWPQNDEESDRRGRPCPSIKEPGQDERLARTVQTRGRSMFRGYRTSRGQNGPLRHDQDERKPDTERRVPHTQPQPDPTRRSTGCAVASGTICPEVSQRFWAIRYRPSRSGAARPMLRRVVLIWSG